MPLNRVQAVAALPAQDAPSADWSGAGEAWRLALRGHWQGLGLATQWVPQVAFVDIGMPGLDGHELARGLREQDNGHRPLLVAVTGWGTGADERRSREAAKPGSTTP